MGNPRGSLHPDRPAPVLPMASGIATTTPASAAQAIQENITTPDLSTPEAPSLWGLGALGLGLMGTWGRSMG